MSYLAFQYAEALFATALEQNVLDAVGQEYKSFLAALDGDIKHFLLHPKVTKEEKKKVLETVTNETVFRHFLFVLIDNHRIQLLEDIHQEFTTILNNQHNVMEATVYSPKPLSPTELANLQESIGKKHNRTVTLSNVIDDKIVGGLRVEYEGHVLDQTINHYLASLKNTLTK